MGLLDRFKRSTSQHYGNHSDGNDSSSARGTTKNVNPVKLGSYVVGGLVALSAAYSSFFTVGETERGLLYTFGKLSTNDTADIKKPGLNFKIPFVQSVRRMPVGIQERVLDKENIYSQDSQDFDARIQYVYQIPESSLIEIAKKLPTNDSIDSIVQNNVLQALKGNFGKKEATDIPSTRNESVAAARADADTQVKAAIGIGINSLTMPNFEWNPKFKESVAKASQMKAEAERARQEVEKTKAEADSAIEVARGQAESKKKLADANLYDLTKAAEGQRKLIEAVGRENLSAYWFKETWNGQLPHAVGGNNMAVTDMNALAAAAQGKKQEPAPKP